jgi:hypothetical protein
MNIPEGMNSDSNSCLLLTKTIDGLVQSAREFNKKLISVLKLMGLRKTSPIHVYCQNGTKMES